ncbi:MAG: hypothetical protein ACLFWI_20580 [Coleofasciculus sp.]|uniref:hypothetical protein n=1 Tax=Coleofasciculus sp. TaxID=3100458 RepID=UPI003A24F7C3
MVTVHLPEVLSGQVKSYTSYGIPATRRTLDGKTFEFVASQALPPGQELEVQIIFPSSILNLPQPQWQQFRFDLQQFFVYMLWSLPVIGIAMMKVLPRRCPRCGKLALETRSQVLVYPTSYKGRKRVTLDCNNCFYHREFEVTIPCSGGDGDGGGGGGGG